MFKMHPKVLCLFLVTLFVTGAPSYAADDIVPDPEKCSIEQASAEELKSVEEVSSNPFEINLKNGVVFHLSQTAPGGLDLLNNLSPEKREVFFRRRKEFLSHFAKFLSFPRLMGSISWVNETMRGCFKKKKISPIEEVVQIQLGESVHNSGKIKRLGYEAIARLLQVLDERIWSDSNVFINAKARSTTFILGLSAGAGIPSLGAYRMIGLQFDFGYDFEKRRLIFNAIGFGKA